FGNDLQRHVLDACGGDHGRLTARPPAASAAEGHILRSCPLRHPMRYFHPVITVVISVLLGACTVGPYYAGPPSVLSSSPPRASGGFARADEATTAGTPAVAEWWAVLGDPVLDDLE